jgi:hypothetical protein
LAAQVAALQTQVDELMQHAKGKQHAVTPRKRAEFLATQADMANQVNKLDASLQDTTSVAKQALATATVVMRTLSMCVSVSLATEATYRIEHR